MWHRHAPTDEKLPEGGHSLLLPGGAHLPHRGFRFPTGGVGIPGALSLFHGFTKVMKQELKESLKPEEGAGPGSSKGKDDESETGTPSDRSEASTRATSPVQRSQAVKAHYESGKFLEDVAKDLEDQTGIPAKPSKPPAKKPTKPPAAAATSAAPSTRSLTKGLRVTPIKSTK
jgi:hypothetical protein